MTYSVVTWMFYGVGRYFVNIRFIKPLKKTHTKTMIDPAY